MDSKKKRRRVRAPSELVPPIFPKELPVVLAGTLAILGCSALFGWFAVRPALHRRWTRPLRHSEAAADQWVLDMNPGKAGYFLDIGAFGSSGASNTRVLEQHGWQGICVDPVPRGFAERGCGVVPRPVGARGGERASPSNCTVDRSGPTSACTEAQTTTLSIGFLLNLVEPPQVIDYVSIGVRGLGLEILENFPWAEYCVRAWTVEHDDEEMQQSSIARILAGRGCQIAQGVADTWAMCPCSGKGGAAQGSPRAARRFPSLA